MLQTILKLPFKYPWIAVLIAVITFGVIKVGILKYEISSLNTENSRVRAELALSEVKLLEIQAENARIEQALRSAIEKADRVQKRLEYAGQENEQTQIESSKEIERIRSTPIENSCEAVRDFLINESKVK